MGCSGSSPTASSPGIKYDASRAARRAYEDTFPVPRRLPAQEIHHYHHNVPCQHNFVQPVMYPVQPVMYPCYHPPMAYSDGWTLNHEEVKLGAELRIRSEFRESDDELNLGE